jgi:hypothetical protein
MTITPADIQLLESERMRDTPDGGGRQTGRVIVSGEMGNVFPKVSRTDAVYGRVNLRKVYAAVRTENVDLYAGSHSAVIEPPENDRIHIAMFSTNSGFDDRTAARNRIESYVVKGPLSRMRLYGDQYEGQMAVATYQRTDEPLPDIGEVFVLSIEGGGLTPDEQFVRVTDVEHETRTFTDSSGDFVRRVITLKIGSRLRRTFPGAEVSRFSADTSPTKVRDTQVADASRYFGIQPLTEAADENDVSLRLASVFTPLVPSTLRETPLSNVRISDSVVPYPAALTHQTVTITTNWTVGATYRLPRGIRPGSATVYLRYFQSFVGTTEINLYDDGNGVMRTTATGNDERGVIDYATGTVTATVQAYTGGLPFNTGSITYRPAAEITNPAHTRQIPITLATRGTVYVETLTPIPEPRTLIVDFRALGKWYRMRDNGAGLIEGQDPAIGTGSVDYVTGAVIITLGAIPDVDSAVIFTWGTPVHYRIRAGVDTIADAYVSWRGTLPALPVVPESVAFSWLANSVTRTATTNSSGVISGNATGTVDPETGEVDLRFTTLPDRDTTLTISYQYLEPTDPEQVNTIKTVSVSGGSPHQIDTGVSPVDIRGSIYVSASGESILCRVRGNSDGTISTAGNIWGYWSIASGQVIGAYDSGTGLITYTANVTASIQVWDSDTAAWNPQSSSFSIDASNVHVYSFRIGATTAASATFTDTLTELVFRLVPNLAQRVVPGSAMFSFGNGAKYVDRAGLLVLSPSITTGAGSPAGSIDYETGDCTLTLWTNNGAVAPRTVDSLLTMFGDWTAVEMFFRTSGSPIRPASLYIQANATDGELITGTADTNGVISGAKMRGTVQQDMGVVAVEFGTQGVDWEPLEILPGTIRYNAVLQTNLPLDAALLGLDPVRLPSDGRVPIYRPADIVIIHHTDTTALDNPVVADTAYPVGRTDLAVAVLYDADDKPIPVDRYEVDLADGEIIIPDDWDGLDDEGDPVPQPLYVKHRVEDMSLVSDVQITGQIEISSPLSREYPLGSYCSSALTYGDLFAHVTNVFDQATWSGVWSDTLIGSQATAQYDDINYPIEVLNQSAVTDRWRINFTSTTAFQVISENVGVVATGTTGTDTAPVNPVTGAAYFVIRAAGWGSGWAAGNQLRFNVVGASGPTWIARTILAGATLEGDQFNMEVRGDVD